MTLMPIGSALALLFTMVRQDYTYSTDFGFNLKFKTLDTFVLYKHFGYCTDFQVAIKMCEFRCYVLIFVVLNEQFHLCFYSIARTA